MNAPFAELLGGVAGFLTTVSFLPQVLKVLRDRQTAGISLGMYSLFTFGVFLWFLYGLTIRSASVILANAVTFLLAGTVLIVKMLSTR